MWNVCETAVPSETSEPETYDIKREDGKSALFPFIRHPFRSCLVSSFLEVAERNPYRILPEILDAALVLNQLV